MAKKQSKASKRKEKQKAEKKRNQIIIGVVAVIVVIIAFLAFGGSGDVPTTENSLPTEIDTNTGYQMFQEGAFLLDVRTQPEWEEYHIDGATMIVLDELEARISEVPFDQEVIIICNSGNRSQVARNILLAAGHTQVTSIAGGIQGWMKAGHAVVSGP